MLQQPDAFGGLSCCNGRNPFIHKGHGLQIGDGMVRDAPFHADGADSPVAGRAWEHGRLMGFL